MLIISGPIGEGNNSNKGMGRVMLELNLESKAGSSQARKGE